MEAQHPERRRLMPLKEANQVFGMQLRIFPELMDTVATLSGGRVGVLTAILNTVGEEISYDPEPETTPQRIREILGAPEDDSQLEQWRFDFWERMMSGPDDYSLLD